MSAEMVTIFMFGFSVLLLVTGLPICYVVGAVGVGSGLLLWGPQSIDILYFSVTTLTKSFVLSALPSFIFMGAILQEAGFAEDLFDMIYKWMGGIRGGLAMGCVLVCTVMAAMVGVSAAATVALGIMAVPPMLKRGYSKHLITGTIQAGGALGFLIPPSVTMIGYSFISGVSLGRLFAAGVIPGLLLAGLYILYIYIRCSLNKELGPPIPEDSRASWSEKVAALKGVILPVALIALVLGGIFSGFCSPTEAASVGAGGALICGLIKRRVTWKKIYDAMISTLKITGLISWIVIGAIVFSKVYTALGASRMIQQFVGEAGVSPWVVLIIIQLSFFLFGMFLDDGAILFICMPVFIPIIRSVGFDPIWFAALYVVNMQMAFLTPPFGYNLFYMKSVVPPEITLKDIYKSVVPFLGLQAVGLILMMIFPQITLWLPNKIFGG